MTYRALNKEKNPNILYIAEHINGNNIAVNIQLIYRKNVYFNKLLPILTLPWPLKLSINSCMHQMKYI